MAIKQGILALLGDGPSHGYQLKADFEARTGDTWLVNVGQVYTTLQRLERDGLVEPIGAQDDERRIYRLTRHGEAAIEAWFASPVVTDPPPRDELTIKVLLAIAAEHVDVTQVLQRQRRASLEQLQEYTRLKAQADPQEQLAWLLLLDALILRTEAEVRWLDTCDARLRRRATTTSSGERGDHATDRPTISRGGRR